MAISTEKDQAELLYRLAKIQLEKQNEAAAGLGSLRAALDKAKALAELQQISTTESEIKRLHLELWIRCNAELRPLQRKQAVELANADTKRGHTPEFDNPRPGQLPDVVR